MCVVSMVMDYGRTNWPWNPQTPTAVPNTTGWETFTTPHVNETTALEAFEKLVAAAAELDRVLGLADCEDPAKAAWLDSVRERVRQHELAKIDQRLNK